MSSSKFICPTCGGTLTYAPDVHKLKCSYCDTTVDFTQTTENDTQDLHCTSCGAELISDGSMISYCPYCGNSTVVTHHVPRDFIPDYLIPFKLTKKDAEKKYQDFYRKKWLLPNSFRSSDRNEMLGVYVPFWLFTDKISFNSEYLAYDINKDGYRKYFDVTMQGELEITNLPVDASEKMDDSIMDTIEPFDINELTEFSNNYLPGFVAEYYDVPSDDCIQRFHKRLMKSADAKAKKALKHKNITKIDSSYEFEGHTIKYALMPIWTIVTNYNNHAYRFVVNGQTGEVLGDLPVSWQHLAILFALVFVIACFICTLITKKFSYSALLALLAACSACTVAYNSMKFSSDKNDKLNYSEAKLNITSKEEKKISNEEAHKLMEKGGK